MWLSRVCLYHGTALLRGCLTVKLRGRTEAPALGAEGAQFLSARGDSRRAPHGPLQQLLGPRPAFPPRTIVSSTVETSVVRSGGAALHARISWGEAFAENTMICVPTSVRG